MWKWLLALCVLVALLVGGGATLVSQRLAPVSNGEAPEVLFSVNPGDPLSRVARRLAAGFLLFRLFDIWKPGPVRWAERLHGGLGIAADDAVAGILANLAIQGLALAIAGGGW